jgi:pimeloyl-ACP methyl ester carboxylesterase
VASLTLADTHRGFGDLTPAQRDDYLRVRREPLLTGRTTRDIAGLLVERLVGRRANAAVHRRLTESVAALRVPSYLKSLEATVNQDRIGELGDIHVPVHFIVGEDDRLTTPTLMRAMAAEVPGAHFTLIEGAGHLTNIEAPEEFNRAVLGFLLEITPR